MELEQDIAGDHRKQLSYKRLERVRGFMCHMATVYDSIFPYLKGFHLTLASHLLYRDEEG